MNIFLVWIHRNYSVLRPCKLDKKVHEKHNPCVFQGAPLSLYCYFHNFYYRLIGYGNPRMRGDRDGMANHKTRGSSSAVASFLCLRPA